MKKIGWIQIVFTVMRVNIGLAGWILDHDARSYELIARVFDGKKEGLTRNEKLDNITLNGIEVVAVHIHKDLKVFFLRFGNAGDFAKGLRTALNEMCTIKCNMDKCF